MDTGALARTPGAGAQLARAAETAHVRADHGTAQRVVVGHEVPQPMRQAERPLPHGDWRKHVVHQVRRSLGHAPSAAPRLRSGRPEQRRRAQLGQNPRPLHENGTSRFRPQYRTASKRTLAPARRTPGTRGTPAPRTAAGHVRRALAPPPRERSPGDPGRFDRGSRARSVVARSGRLDAPRDRTVARRVPSEGPSEIRIERSIVRERWQFLRSARLDPWQVLQERVPPAALSRTPRPCGMIRGGARVRGRGPRLNVEFYGHA
jgi:hypothetical protein